MRDDQAASKWTYAGLFLVSLTTLLYEVLLTRIFSVIMWYHFAFMAISVAMFGMTAGALLVYLLPNVFTTDRTKRHLALTATLFGGAILITFLIQQCIPFTFDTSTSIISYFAIAFTFLVIAVPFVLSGICICLALTRFPLRVSSLYGADLIGAAFGCVLLVVVLNVTDGPTAVLVASTLGCLSGLFFAADGGAASIRKIAVPLVLVLGGFALFHGTLVQMEQPIFRLLWVRGKLEQRPQFEKWNSHSRITLTDVDLKRAWGPTIAMSPKWKQTQPIDQKRMWIDVDAGTPMTEFSGDLAQVDFLKHCMMNTAHYLRPNADVLAIGVGGGKDVLSALVFEQKSVLGLEVNAIIFDVLTNRYADYAGRIHEHPKVELVNDEARSYLTRSDREFDIITIPFVDTFAATAAGAYIMAENALYTAEAWRIFLEHLQPNGIVTASRLWIRSNPLQVYRLASLAHQGLVEFGVENPRAHIAILVRSYRLRDFANDAGVATILVARDPFSAADLDTLEQHAADMGFEVALSPRHANDPAFEKIASGQEPTEVTAKYPVDVSATTDDKPYFFNILRIREALGWEPFEQPFASANVRGIRVLSILLVTVTVLTFLCIVAPLLAKGRRDLQFAAVPYLLLFGSIGCGFMLVEVAQMQRLILFLGHPTYAFIVVLSVLLVTGGIGSQSTASLTRSLDRRRMGLRIALLLAVLVLAGAGTVPLLRVTASASTPLRIGIATLLLAPMGFFMGMPFPLGMSLAGERLPNLTPWLWGANGATSVFASVLAMAISLDSGISATFWAGVACYGVAALAFAWQAIAFRKT